MMPSDRFDLAVIGGGIVGLATAMQLIKRYPRAKMAVLEKEAKVASHQSGHNSGVIHSGIYYRPGSVKAKICVSGRKSLLKFCDKHDIPYKLCGKVIVATHKEQLPQLDELMKRGMANGVTDLEMIGPDRLQGIEPNTQGIMAIHSPSTGVIDFTQVAQAMATRFMDRGGEILTSYAVQGIAHNNGGWRMKTPSGEIACEYLINCAGLYSDRLAQMTRRYRSEETHSPGPVQIVPFRGEFYQLIPERRHLVRGLIYPVPDPRLPFLGVHCSRTIHGNVEVGPNAVLAFAREGYEKNHINFRDLWQILSFRGFWALARAQWRTGVNELYRSISKDAFVRDLRQLLPEAKSEDLVPAGSGVRAQAVSSDGRLLDDFVIEPEPKAIHVLNAPSPGATASLAIGKRIREMASEVFSPSIEKFQ